MFLHLCVAGIAEVLELAVLFNVGVDARDLHPDRGQRFGKLSLGNGLQVHNVWPVCHPQRPDCSVHPRQLGVLPDAVRAVRLDGLVDDLERHPWGRHLDHRNVRARGFEPSLVGDGGCQVAEQSVLCYIDPGLSL